MYLHVVVSGKVQGVWFRAWTKEQAERLKLSGWVRNLENGQVEALFSGNKSELAIMLELLHQGPPKAEVRKVEEVGHGDVPESEFYDFRILR